VRATSGFISAHIINSSKIAQNDFWSPKYPTLFSLNIGRIGIYFWLTPVSSHGYNSAYIRDRVVILHQTGVFEVRQFNGALKFSYERPLLPWQPKFGNFNTQLTVIRIYKRYSRQSCTKQGFSSQAIYWTLVSLKCIPDRSLLPWQPKVGNFNTKLTITRLMPT